MAQNENKQSQPPASPFGIKALDKTPVVKAVIEGIFKKGFLLKKNLMPLFEAAERDDEFAVVVRAAAVMETAMNEAIQKLCTADATLYARVHFGWQNLVRLCTAVGMIDKKMENALAAFGRLRNRYAHEHDFRVGANMREYIDVVETTRPLWAKSEQNRDDIRIVITLTICAAMIAGWLDLQLIKFFEDKEKVTPQPSSPT